MKPKILAFAGSARSASYNKMLAAVAAAHGRAIGADVTLIDLRDFPMPIYDGDVEAASGLPAAALRFRELLVEHDGLLVASPEHNGSVTALLKNTLDWASRPAGGIDGLALFRGKTVGLMAASLSPFGGLRSVTHLRGILSKLGANVLADEVLVAGAQGAFDETGGLTNELSNKLTAQLVATLAANVRRMHAP
ncbi:NAD(P)H-dependent oxidoreductase [Variovorax robiniae]|uniref:NAD(P)H-dependent oxidoreductase n=1 Tax=Variovorax robiniae TaxID=1836199 RepID=A0ABU8XH06_9BURK